MKYEWIIWQRECGLPKPKEGTYRNAQHWDHTDAKWYPSKDYQFQFGQFHRYKRIK